MSKITIGVLLLGPGVQMLDLAAIDVLGMLRTDYMSGIPIPDELKSMGIEIEYHYISESGSEGGKGWHGVTGGGKVAVTDSLQTCPPLTHLLIPGPPPDYDPSSAVKKFLSEQLESPNLEAFMTVCTGVIPVLKSGLLANKTVSAPLKLIPGLKEEFKQTTFVEKRWWRDGKVWSSGGVTNGLDMMSGYLREVYGDRKEVVEMLLGMADVGDRGQEYKA